MISAPLWDPWRMCFTPVIGPCLTSWFPPRDCKLHSRTQWRQHHSAPMVSGIAQDARRQIGSNWSNIFFSVGEFSEVHSNFGVWAGCSFDMPGWAHVWVEGSLNPPPIPRSIATSMMLLGEIWTWQVQHLKSRLQLDQSCAATVFLSGLRQLPPQFLQCLKADTVQKLGISSFQRKPLPISDQFQP